MKFCWIGTDVFEMEEESELEMHFHQENAKCDYSTAEDHKKKPCPSNDRFYSPNADYNNNLFCFKHPDKPRVCISKLHSDIHSDISKSHSDIRLPRPNSNIFVFVFTTITSSGCN